MTDPTPGTALPDELSLGRIFRRFYQILTLIFCLFLVVRTTFVEPHGVPTGSMAPAIFGDRRQCQCPRCDYPIVVGAPQPGQSNSQTAAYCPNCGLSRINAVPLSDEIFGDRILVDRLIFRLRPPRRWEIAVFQPPDDSKIPYVKRVVGLPGEAMRIHDGDAYADGELLRKSLDAIREMKVPIFDMDHPPKPMGWACRWDPGSKPIHPVEETVVENRLILDASATVDAVLGLSYRHRNVDSGLDELIRDDLAYNGSRGVPKAVHDFLVECEVEVLGGTGGFSLRLGDSSESVRLALAIGPEDAAPSVSMLSHDGNSAKVNYPTLRLNPGRRYRVEFAFVDRRAFAVIDGLEIGAPLEVFVPKLVGGKLPADRPGTDRPLKLEARGVSMVVHRLKLFRDVQYRSEGENGIAAPWQLGPNDYFLLGDNSASSEDSRYWKKAGVPEGDFIGKPFLVHQPLRIGRLVLNGNEHRFQTIDWDRFRFLR